jgi:hypothetical protein
MIRRYIQRRWGTKLMRLLWGAPGPGGETLTREIGPRMPPGMRTNPMPTYAPEGVIAYGIRGRDKRIAHTWTGWST